MVDRRFDVAELTSRELEAVRKAEEDIKSATGRSLVLIAWNELGDAVGKASTNMAQSNLSNPGLSDHL